ncbi:MAG: PAS domain S-box protein [candidate division Zixibacteria bacterium]|nr:PAS domain S-box protein [candidate division Zixibacteria bacterium]
MKRYESEVHLGLLAIILALVFLSFLSNLVIYRTREAKRESLTSSMESAAVVIGRALPSMAEPHLNAEQEAQLKRTFQLSRICIFPTRPADGTREARLKWFRVVAQKLPVADMHDLAEKLFTSEYQSLTRGSNDQYFLVSPIPGNRYNLLILSREDVELAYLDDSQRLVATMGVVVVIVLIGIYLLLSKIIFSPLRKLKLEAKHAGRSLDAGEDDADAVVEEYRRVIHELRKQEQQLLRLNEIIRQKADSLEQFNKYLLQSIRSGIVTFDLEGNIVTVNDAAESMLGVTIEGCIGKAYGTVIPDGSVISSAVSMSLKDLTATDYQETDMTGPDGRHLTVGVSTSVICGGNDQPLGVSLLLNNLSEVTQLRTELEVKERMAALGELAGGLAHQLRNSMGAISGYLTLLKKRLDQKDTVEDSVAALIAEAAEAQDLLECFLQYARPLQINGFPEVLADLVFDVVSSFQVRQDLTAIRFRIEADMQLTVILDALLFKQVLGNLIENAALAYGPDGGEVLIEVSEADGNVIIEVSDNGCGIPIENLDKIFTPFFSSRAAGTGLGLSLASKIVDLHGGRLTVTSEANQRTVFSVILPMIPTPDQDNTNSGVSAQVVT